MRALIIMVCLALGACAVPTAGSGGVLTTSPAPLAHSVSARQAVVTAYQGFQVAVQATELLVKAGIIKPGSPKALALASINDRINAALKAANRAIDAGSDTDYSAALSDAQASLVQLQVAIGSK